MILKGRFRSTALLKLLKGRENLKNLKYNTIENNDLILPKTSFKIFMEEYTVLDKDYILQELQDRYGAYLDAKSLYIRVYPACPDSDYFILEIFKENILTSDRRNFFLLDTELNLIPLKYNNKSVCRFKMILNSNRELGTIVVSIVDENGDNLYNIVNRNNPGNVEYKEWLNKTQFRSSLWAY